MSVINLNLRMCIEDDFLSLAGTLSLDETMNLCDSAQLITRLFFTLQSGFGDEQGESP